MASTAANIRVLHLYTSPVDFQTRRALDALAVGDKADVRARAFSIGPGGDASNRVAAILSIREPKEWATLVHCWDAAAFSFASVFLTRKRILYSPQSAPSPSDMRWLLATRRTTNVDLVVPSGPLHRLYVEKGFPIDRCHLIRPGVDFSLIRRDRDGARAALGLKREEYILLAPGESTDAAGHFTAAWAASIYHVLDDRCRLLVWGKGRRSGSVARRTRRLGQPDLLVVGTEQLGPLTSFESLLSAADAAIVSPNGPLATLPIAQCMAAGIPTVATAGPASAELLEDRHTALLAKEAKPRLIVEKLMQIRENDSLRRELSQNASAEAYKVWPLSGFMDRWRKVYQQAGAGERIGLE